MKHTCHAIGCDKACHPTKLMCLSCWKLVSKETQGEVYNTYRTGQCDDKEITKKWLISAKKAIMEVKSKRKENEN